MSQIRVAVLRGGPSSEYEVSLKSGQTVLKNLPEKYHAKDILISRDGLWHMDGIVKSPDKILKSMDVVFNALHGEYGEDGQVQKILESHNVPYTGSDSVASAVAMNKHLTKQLAIQNGIRTPDYLLVREGDDLTETPKKVFAKFAPPYIVKPTSLGSSVGVTIVKTANDLLDVIRSTIFYSRALLIEEYIFGKEATCGVIDSMRGHDVYSLLPVEIIPKKGEFYDYNAKYLSDSTGYRIPGHFNSLDKKEIEQIAKKIHSLLGLRHYSRSDFIVSPLRGIFFLEVNTLPGMTDHSLIPKSLDALGISLPDFLDHMLTLATARH